MDFRVITQIGFPDRVAHARRYNGAVRVNQEGAGRSNRPGRFDMPRSAGGRHRSARDVDQGPVAVSRDPLHQTLHYLGNNLHSLNLRLFVLQNAALPADARTHVEAAHRLAGQSVTLVERIHELLNALPPATRRARPATRRGR